MDSTNVVIETSDKNVSVEEVSKPHRAKGFAAMDPAKVREISSLGGRAAHAKKTAHRFTKEEASIAGKKGGLKTQHNKRAHKTAAA